MSDLNTKDIESFQTMIKERNYYLIGQNIKTKVVRYVAQQKFQEALTLVIGVLSLFQEEEINNECANTILGVIEILYDLLDK